MNPQRSDRYFFTGLGIWAFLLTFIGFSPTFYLRPAEKDPLPFYIVLHGVLASIWVLFFLLQAGLISAKQRKLHATLGLISIPLCLAVVATLPESKVHPSGHADRLRVCHRVGCDNGFPGQNPHVRKSGAAPGQDGLLKAAS